MSENTQRNNRADDNPRDRYFGAIILIGIGLLGLVGNLVQSELFGLLLLPLLGLIFLAWGFYTQRFGLIIPGCILSGLGLATLLSARILRLDGDAAGGVVVFGLALGFLAIPLIAPLMKQPRHLWGFIPAAILGFVGLTLIIGGDALKLLAALGTVWPLIPVAIGIYILFQPKKRSN